MLFSICFEAVGQHNNSLFLLHDVPESNLLNPAVRTPCKWYIGMPILSSTHLNYSNNSFTYKELIASDNTVNVNGIVDQMHWRNYFGTEFQTQILAVGYNNPKISLVFSITEKNNIPITLPKDAFELAWYGNTQFEGSTAGLKGTGLYLNHYREYALSTSRPFWGSGFWGVRAKLLFGKLNVSTRNTDISVNTNETTFDLEFDGDLLVHSSLPIDVEVEGNVLTRLQLSDDFDAVDLIFNGKNPGFALDFGFVYPYSSKLQLSASVIDLGFIRWRSNLNSFSGNGNFVYQGALSNTIPIDDYLDSVIDELMESFEFDVEEKKYTTFLPTIVMAGGNYQVNNYLSAGLVGRVQFYRSKVIPSATMQGVLKPHKSIQVMASYTLQYYDYKQVGFGLVLGRRPMQFYAVTDNLVGMIWPLSTRSVNLRFGLNLILGCSNESSPNKVKSSCNGIEQTRKKKYMRKLKRGCFDRKY